MKIVVFFKFIASIFGLDNEILVLSQDRSNLFDDWNNLSEVCRFAEQNLRNLTLNFGVCNPLSAKNI